MSSKERKVQLINQINKYFKIYELILIFLLIFIDQLTKIVIDQYVLVGGVIYTNFLFSITKIYNTGISFSFLFNKIFLILIMTVIALFFLIKMKEVYTSKIPNIGICLILAGAVGNLIDRILYGHVIDYINFNIIQFPIFNFADILITFGFIIIIFNEVYVSLKKERSTHGK